MEELDKLERMMRADYAGPGRFYHNLDHLDDCLAKLDSVPELHSEERRLLRFALLWHDVVYDPGRTDNEERSARRSEHELREAGVDSAEAAEVRRLILLTRGHRVEPGDRLGALMVSIDLSILGAEPNVYGRYSDAIRREYAHVPEDAYRAGRRSVLQNLLAANPIFPDPAFAAKYEARARPNLARELRALSPP